MIRTSIRYSLRPQKYQNINNVVRCALFESMINYNSRTNRKSTTRTLRIPQKLDKLLERDAEDKRVSINSLISSIITKYAEWDRYSELLQFVSIPPDMFKLLVGSLDDEKIKEIGQQMGSRHMQYGTRKYL